MSKKTSYMIETQRAADALKDAEVVWEKVKKYMDAQIGAASNLIKNPTGTGDMRLRDLSSAYIMAMTLQEVVSPMEKSVVAGERLMKQRLRTRKISSPTFHKEKSMTSLKEQLIRLGSERPELRKDLTPVIAHLEKEANYSSKELVDFLKENKEITVRELTYAFGGTPQSHTKKLEKMIQDGILVRDRNKYRLAGTNSRR